MESKSAKRPDASLSLLSELKRKSIHLSMIIIPLWVYFIPPHISNIGLIIATLLTIGLDVLRLSDHRLRRFFYRFFRSLIRRHEEEHLLGSTYLMVAALISVLLFEKQIAIASLSFLVLGDTAAAVIGKKYGRLRYGGKSLEGSAACFLVCLVVGLLALGGRAMPALAGAAAATIAEALPAPMDDNMRVPILSGLVMQLIWYML